MTLTEMKKLLSLLLLIYGGGAFMSPRISMLSHGGRSSSRSSSSSSGSGSGSGGGGETRRHKRPPRRRWRPREPDELMKSIQSATSVGRVRGLVSPVEGSSGGGNGGGGGSRFAAGASDST